MDLRTLNYFVAVAEELHFGRAAARLAMTQPPLSRAIKQLETDLGAVLLTRSPAGVTLTPAGSALYDETRLLLKQLDQLRSRVAIAAGADTITIGTLGDSVEQAGPDLIAAFREQHPGITVRIHEADFTDPTIGLRTGLVDVAITRSPFDDTGIATQVLRSDPVGAVLRTDDPLADRESLTLADLADRPWFRLPEGADPRWRAYWTGEPIGARATDRLRDADRHRGDSRGGPIVRTVHECMQSVLWNGTVGIAPLGHDLPPGLTIVPLSDRQPSHLVLAWSSTNRTPPIRSLARIAATLYR
ncbi:LysR substrate-binding domain-containing protein [Kribbella sp. NBC_00382]|uniref:LysR substrate-binding domain-containing protein n=1 Tax=Kribbella sp. NBC_00382 TaxID=2975967 RepID=UPI002E208EE7